MKTGSKWDLKNVEIGLLSKLHQNTTFSSEVIVLKWLVLFTVLLFMIKTFRI